MAGSDEPAADPPQGITPNFVDPPSLHKVDMGVVITCMTLMAISLGVRTYTKVLVLRDVRHEDYVALFALLLFLILGPIYIHLSNLGISRDQWNIRQSDIPRLLYLCNVFQIHYVITMGAAKYFICAHLKRIFCPSHRSAVWWVLQLLIAINLMFYITCFFTFIFQCTPREKIWKATLAGSCMRSYVGLVSIGITNLVLDVGILAVPIWAIWHLHSPLKRKLEAFSLFAVGIVTCAIAAASLAFRLPSERQTNMSLDMAKIDLWSFAELTGTTLVGCLPYFPRFLGHFHILTPTASPATSQNSTPPTTGESNRETRVSKIPELVKSNTRSEDHIIIDTEYVMDDIRHNPDSIDLGNSDSRTTDIYLYHAV